MVWSQRFVKIRHFLAILLEKCQNAQVLKIIWLTPFFKMLSFEDKFTLRYETNFQKLVISQIFKYERISPITPAIFELFLFEVMAHFGIAKIQIWASDTTISL